MSSARTTLKLSTSGAPDDAGLSVLVTHAAHAIVPAVVDHALVRSVHVEAFRGDCVRKTVERHRPDVLITTPQNCDAVTRVLARASGSKPPIVAVTWETEACPLPPRGGTDRNCEFVTLPAPCGRLGELLARVRDAAHATEDRPRSKRVLVVSPRDQTASALLRGLVGGDPPIAALLVDGIDLARRWLRAVEFDCIILCGPLADGHGIDCLQDEHRQGHPPALGVCATDDAQEAASFVRGGCTDVLTLRDLTSRSVVHQRASELIGRGRSSGARAADETKRLMSLLEREQQELITAARSDRVTGVLSRAAFEELMADSHSRCMKGEDGYALLVFDIDHFKAINDRCGHQRGDEVLRLTAQAMTKALGDRGLLARVGGEEFAVICTGRDKDEAMQIAEDVRASVQAASPADLRLTISGGVATAPHPGAESGHQVYALADAALYSAKGAGRNRVLLAA